MRDRGPSGPGDASDEARAAALRRRRIAAARVRRRRLLVGDLGIAAALVVFGLIVAPGLAIIAIGALIVLAACVVWIVLERRHARRGGGRGRGRRPRRQDGREPGQ
jgi:Flp pilus assembly protein TadB